MPAYDPPELSDRSERLIELVLGSPLDLLRLVRGVQEDELKSFL
jgi:hypothetical protein